MSTLFLAKPLPRTGPDAAHMAEILSEWLHCRVKVRDQFPGPYFMAPNVSTEALRLAAEAVMPMMSWKVVGVVDLP